MRDLPNYREFTFGWLIIVFAIPVMGLMTFFYFTGLGDRPLTLWPLVLVDALMVLTILLFYGLTTEVTRDTITVWFGSGLIRKTIPISRITAVESVKSPWYYGWGIRLIPRGMMFNISGFESVELKFNDTNRVFRIGSKQPSMLKKEIEARMRLHQ